MKWTNAAARSQLYEPQPVINLKVKDKLKLQNFKTTTRDRTLSYLCDRFLKEKI
nr:hypothetical protein [Nostoc sp. ChiSLP03a]MDZ8215885.1 hypothetical protein [Nostoc sp. ChiSLP03a]